MKITLRGVIFVLLLAWCLPTLSFAESGKRQLETLLSAPKVVATVKLYTAYNLYSENGQVDAINFQIGDIIPAGTPVKVKVANNSNVDYNGGSAPVIKFTTLANRKHYTLKFKQRYHPGKTIYDYANMMFGTQTFAEMTAGKTPEVIDAIKRAAVIEGMTKEEVIISYGYPAEHRTPSLRSNTWVFWENRFRDKQICFNGEEIAMPCQKARNNDL